LPKFLSIHLNFLGFGSNDDDDDDDDSQISITMLGHDF